MAETFENSGPDLLEEFSRLALGDPDASFDRILRAEERELTVAVQELREARDLLNAPELSGADPAGAGLRDELSGKRFPNLQGCLEMLAGSLQRQPRIARRCRITPELCREVVAQDQAIGRLMALLEVLYCAGRDASIVYIAAAVGLGQRTLGAVRRALRDAGPGPSAVRDVFGDLLDRELAPGGRTRTVLDRLAERFLGGRA